MSDAECQLMKSVARISKDDGCHHDRPASPVAIAAMLGFSGDTIRSYSWSDVIPDDVLRNWERLTNDFKLGVMAVACSDVAGMRGNQ